MSGVTVLLVSAGVFGFTQVVLSQEVGALGGLMVLGSFGGALAGLGMIGHQAFQYASAYGEEDTSDLARRNRPAPRHDEYGAVSRDCCDSCGRCCNH